MRIVGRKGYYRCQKRDTKRVEDGKEVLIPGSWTRIYGQVAPNGDDVYVPVVEEKDGLVMMRIRDLTLKAKTCKMQDLPGQRISFMRKDPDKDITRREDQEQRLIPGKPVKHSGRIGLDMRQVYIPIITDAGDRVPVRFESFMFEEKSKGDK